MNYIDFANELIHEGINPLPLFADKSPKLPVGHNFLYEKINRVGVRFATCQAIGVACGEVSGGFYAIDFDCHQGQNLKPIIDDFLKIPLIVQLLKEEKLSHYSTPSGGAHFYFRCEKLFKSTILAKWIDGKTKIEIIGNGKYVCTYPSPNYQHINGTSFLECQFSDYYDIENLFIICKSFSDVENKSSSGRKWSGEWTNSTPQGQFNNNEGEEVAKQLLIEAGWQYHSTRHDGVELWTRPGKEIRSGISATWNAKPKMFYVFTSSDKNFEGGKAYSPFDVLVALKFNGNWKEAKRYLLPNLIDNNDDEKQSTKFPLDVFPDFFKEFIIELNRTLNFSIDFCSVAFMFSFATLIGNKYKIRVKRGWETPPIFWFACVGFPGAIKTHPLKLITSPLTKIDMYSKKIYDNEMDDYRQNEETNQRKPKFKQLLISDYTIEALHSIHNINKRGIGLYKDELKGFLNDMNKYRKGSDVEFWLESFNNGSYIVNRATKEPQVVENICINIIGTIQHDVLSEVIAEYKGSGFIDRFLFTAAEENIYSITQDEINQHFLDVWHSLCNDINTTLDYNENSPSEILLMDNDCFNAFQRIDKRLCELQLQHDQSQTMKNYLSKMKTYIPRFALLFCLIDAFGNDGFIELSPIHFDKAGSISDYFILVASQLFSQTELYHDIKSAESLLRGQKTSEKIISLIEKGYSRSDVARFYGVTKQYISKLINKK